MPEAMRLWRPVCGRRDKSADVAGRIGCTTLTAVLTEVLQRTTPPHESLMVVSDADHRASRTGELFEALQGVAPELDPLQQVTRVGEACGDLGRGPCARAHGAGLRGLAGQRSGPACRCGHPCAVTP